MEIILLVVGLIIIVNVFKFFTRGNTRKIGTQVQSPRYFYSRKNNIMTAAEWRFFEKLNRVVAGRYYVFPQIHLSSLLKNNTRGRYYKLAFQRINRRSVDFVLCDMQSARPVYAVELDDWSHDSAKRQARDSAVEDMLNQAGLPLVRFRKVDAMTDEDIANKFREVANRQATEY